MGAIKDIFSPKTTLRSPRPVEIPTPPPPPPFVTPTTVSILEGSRGMWTSLSGRFLRDLCSCSTCCNASTKQKQTNVLRMGAKETTIMAAKELPNENVQVIFEDGHRSVFTRPQLTHRTIARTHRNRNGIVVPRTTWTAATISPAPPRIQYSAVHSSSSPGMGALTLALRTHGLVFIDNTPITPSATQYLLELIGPIRNTHYGGFYDFTSDLSSKDTAYTSEALDPHTDNTYFTEPAGLQALHMLSHTDGSGGLSALVDGNAAAEQLHALDPRAYEILSTTGVHAHASGNEGVSIQPSQAFPTIAHHALFGGIKRIRWNTADRAGVAATSHKEMEEWYDAAAKFDAILSDKANQYWFQLEPGTTLIFDNWRVLHARSAFTGKRRMCGGYINRDDFISRFRSTNLTEGERGESTVTG